MPGIADPKRRVAAVDRGLPLGALVAFRVDERSQPRDPEQDDLCQEEHDDHRRHGGGEVTLGIADRGVHEDADGDQVCGLGRTGGGVAAVDRVLQGELVEDDPVVDEHSDLQQHQSEHRVERDHAKFLGEIDSGVAGGRGCQHQRHRASATSEGQPEGEVVLFGEFVPRIDAEQQSGHVPQGAYRHDGNHEVQHDDGPDPDTHRVEHLLDLSICL